MRKKRKLVDWREHYHGAIGGAVFDKIERETAAGARVVLDYQRWGVPLNVMIALGQVGWTSLKARGQRSD